MNLFEVVLRVAPEDLLIRLSKEFRSFKVYAWCNRENDIIEISIKDPKEYPFVMERLGKPPPNTALLATAPHEGVHVIKKHCTCMNETGVIKLIDDLAMLHVSPSVVENGWHCHHLIVFSHSDLEELLNRLELAEIPTEVVQKVPSNGFVNGLLTVHADALFSNLTQKQMSALMTAYRNGYYEFPRKASVKALAARKKVPRTTFHEHLQKAENKLVSSLVPYINLYTRSHFQ